MKKTNILHLIYCWETGIYGAESVVLNLASNLPLSGFNTRVFALEHFREKPIPLLDELKKRNIPTGSLVLNNRLDISAIGKLRKILREAEIDILHCHGYKADMLGALAVTKLPGVKTVATLHGWWTGKSPKLKIYNLLDLISLRSFSRVVAVSPLIERVLREKKSLTEKLEMIPNGICLEKFNQNIDAGGLRKELQLAADEIIIGAVGRLSGEKGHKYLLEAVPELLNIYPRVKFLIFGEGYLEKELKHLSVRLRISDRVIFMGFQKNMELYYALMDIFVLPSLSEGLPMALLEAMAAGKAIIAANTGGIPSVIINNETGILVEPMNTGALAKAIIFLMGNSSFSRRVSSQAQVLIKNNFSVDSMVRKYESVYERILKG